MKVLFAGSENNESAQIMSEIKAKNLLLSYYYLRDKKDPTKILDKLKASAETLFLDSGAHTFFHEAGISVVHGEKKQKTELPPDQYLKNYIEWLKQYGHYFDGYAELDIDQIVGHEKIMEWHKLWKESKLPNVVYVYHPSQPIEYWEKICKENKYVGIQGNLPLGQYNRYFKVPMKYKTKVHGFAMTKTEPMLKIPFYSVDSTSWQSGTRFGMTYIFDGRSLSQVGGDEKVKIRKRYATKAEAVGIDSKKWIADQRYEVDKWNLYQWMLFEDYMDKHCKKYWDEGKKEQGIGGETPIKSLDNADKDKSHLADTLPESTKGKIQLILRDNPEIEARRRLAVSNALRGNMNQLKTGKYLTKTLYCNNCYGRENCPLYQAPENENQKVMCAYDEIFDKTFDADKFDVRDEDTVKNTFNKMTQHLAKKLGRGIMYEDMDGGMIDKNLMPIYKMLSEMMMFNKMGLQVNVQNNYYGTAENIDNVRPDEKEAVLEFLRQRAREDDTSGVSESSVAN